MLLRKDALQRHSMRFFILNYSSPLILKLFVPHVIFHLNGCLRDMLDLLEFKYSDFIFFFTKLFDEKRVRNPNVDLW